MRQHQRTYFVIPRIPLWGWILLLPLALLGIFLGAVFFLVFVSFVFAASLIMWLRWKWLTRKMRRGQGQGPVIQESRHARGHDYELHRLDDHHADRKNS